MLNYIADKFPEITSLLYCINPKGNETIFDLDIITFKGNDFINEEMEGLKFKIGPKSFYQTNSIQAYELYKLTRDFADISEDDLVYDLYTGTGTIAQFLSRKAKKVVGIESVPEAIEAAKENAKNNNIENCVFYVGDMKEVFTESLSMIMDILMLLSQTHQEMGCTKRWLDKFWMLLQKKWFM